ncbi:MAG: response regulator [Bacteroidales bacterium]|nr:response regulator [Bacteroidales bacterium]
MDIKMPEMDGIEATRLIKKQNKNIPIIIQTAFAMKEVKDEAIEAGCDGFIVKPIALDDFLELVNQHIK